MTFLHTVREIVARHVRLSRVNTHKVAREIADLAEVTFGPFDPEVEAAWIEADRRDLTHSDLASLLSEAARDVDPLQFLKAFPSERARPEAYMRVRWSSLRARRNRRPETPRGLAWSHLDEDAQSDVRDGLERLAQQERGHVRRGARPM